MAYEPTDMTAAGGMFIAYSDPTQTLYRYDLDGDLLGTFSQPDNLAGMAAFAARGDANMDGIVNIVDLSTLSDNWQGTGEWSDGDFNGDGIVNILDLSDLSANWGYGEATAPMSLGSSRSTGAVPEPATLVLSGAVALLLLLRRRAA